MPVEKLDLKDVEQAYNEMIISTGQTPGEWRNAVVKSIDETLMQSPLSYRNYGPYWWNLKKVLQKNFENEQDCYEGDIEIQTAISFDYGSDRNNIVAALLYVNAIRADVFENSEIHGVGIDYVIEDMDMERAVSVGKFPPSYWKPGVPDEDDDEEVDTEETEI
jgi:hypothetical protein